MRNYVKSISLSLGQSSRLNPHLWPHLYTAKLLFFAYYTLCRTLTHLLDLSVKQMESVRQCSCHMCHELTVTTSPSIDQTNFRIGKDQNPGCTFRTFYRWIYRWIQSLLGETWPKEYPPTLQAKVLSVERLKSKLAKLKKQHSSSDKEVAISGLSGFLRETILGPVKLYSAQRKIRLVLRKT